MNRWVRSWPEYVPPHKTHIIDDLPRVTVKDYDYRTLIPYNTDHRLNHLDWDVAIGREDVERMDELYRLYPNRVVVAPIYYYDETLPRYVHQQVVPISTQYPRGMRWMTAGENLCDYAGFSCISIPPNFLQWCDEWLKTLHNEDQRITDTRFSDWMYQIRHEKFVVDWRIQAVHLNYPVQRLTDS